MSAPDTRLDVRLVPMTWEKVVRYSQVDDELEQRYLAAPADPAAIVRSVALSFYVEDADEDATPAQREIADMLADVLLSALGCVPARETNEKPA